MADALPWIGICLLAVALYAAAEALGEALIEGLFYWTARIILPAITAGRIRVAGLREEIAGLDAAGFQRTSYGFLISPSFAVGFGVVVWFVALALLLVAAFWQPA